MVRAHGLSTARSPTPFGPQRAVSWRPWFCWSGHRAAAPGMPRHSPSLRWSRAGTGSVAGAPAGPHRGRRSRPARSRLIGTVVAVVAGLIVVVRCLGLLFSLVLHGRFEREPRSRTAAGWVRRPQDAMR